MNTTNTIQLAEECKQLQKENDELLETLKRATAMVIKLNEEARELDDENQRLVGLIIKLKAEIDKLKGNTKDNPSGLSLGIYQGKPH